MFSKEKKEWFSDWFDSEYYHILYKNRNDEEASIFINALLEFLNPPPEAHFLDLACGKGRHSIYINSLGFNVTGLDLSNNSISHALKNKSKSLNFFVHDMREHFGNNKYDYILNLFTSFGYFENEKDNEKVLFNVFGALKQEGIFVIDFMNVKRVEKNLVALEEKTINNINYTIQRHVDYSFITKQIDIRDGNKEFIFIEKVQYLTNDKIINMLNHCGFKIKATFGSYQLQSFDEQLSDRLIIVCQK